MSLSGGMTLNIREVQARSSILFGNIAGLYPGTNKVKVQFVMERTKENNCIITALPESHLKSYIFDAEIYISGYQIFRTDRRDKINKGGVILYIRDDFAKGSKLFSHGCNGVVEWICLYLPVIRSLIINVYTLVMDRLSVFRKPRLRFLLRLLYF